MEELTLVFHILMFLSPPSHDEHLHLPGESDALLDKRIGKLTEYLRMARALQWLPLLKPSIERDGRGSPLCS